MDRTADSAESTDPLVVVGEVTAPFGIRGQIKVRPLLEDARALQRVPGGVVLRYPDGREETRRVKGVGTAAQRGAATLTVEGIDTRDASEAMRGVLLLIRKSQLPPLEEDAFYEGDLIGLKVVTESGRDLGVIEQVHFYPANDVYETADAMIPAIADVVVKVDVAGGTMIVRDMPGLRKDE